MNFFCIIMYGIDVHDDIWYENVKMVDKSYRNGILTLNLLLY